MRTLVWFRGKDLRLTDHEPLQAALTSRGEVIPAFVLDPYFFAPERAQAIPHRIQFLLESLDSLAKNIEHKGSRLILLSGKSTLVLPEFARTHKVDRVVAQRWVEPFAQERDRRVRAALEAHGIAFDLFEGETLRPPGSVRSGEGTPYSVFTPFARANGKLPPIGAPLPAPKALPPLPAGIPPSICVPQASELGIAHNPGILHGGEKEARARLAAFLKSALATYAPDRDRMDLPGTSRLSADLKFGTISVRTVWNAVMAEPTSKARDAYLNELLWREFAHHSLWDRPTLLETPYRRDFRDFPYEENDAYWNAWIQGKTGYPVVDASARQLLAEGFVHNRARMISASFLTKHLLMDYRKGEAHYMRFLTDGDWAANNMGWQWSAGSGCDAQPYFRIFHPVTQGEKFDPEGAYVRRWVPELAKMNAKYIHAPWDAPPSVLAEAGVQLGENYPYPIVDHKTARARFLERATNHIKRPG